MGTRGRREGGDTHEGGEMDKWVTGLDLMEVVGVGRPTL